MTDQRTTVDVLSLEDFHDTLTARLAEAEFVLRQLDNELACRPPQLGEFADANAGAKRYNELLQEHRSRALSLRAAIVAAKEATTTIIANYSTTEARNRANAEAIGSALTGVYTALEGE
ncbi:MULTISPECIES: hypothetical protein [Actinoplanes]|uniref:Uncharacterized protein n=2 Tax=Actinoplanes TaxID=1865 RepID=A0A117MPT6_9ACTN|nr:MULTISPECIES: hypothetical protein [Actinoplanes]KUL29167.1 hypothetical protein ADL15_28805 [Actinoplanes awajinensis subsp. mycoplanecinus]GIE64349.1 hypothetical protein Apa02nite_004570 [Actinoplanes palleronii]